MIKPRPQSVVARTIGSFLVNTAPARYSFLQLTEPVGSPAIVMMFVRHGFRVTAAATVGPSSRGRHLEPW